MKPSNPVQMQKVTNQGAAFIDSFFGNLVGGVVGVLEGGGKAAELGKLIHLSSGIIAVLGSGLKMNTAR